MGIVPIHWVYPIPRPDAEKDVSAWTEIIQERFQTAYAGMRERQQQMVRRRSILQANLEPFQRRTVGMDL